MSGTEDAPGAPGIAPTWTSSAKDLVTTAVEGAGRLWATVGFGIVNEVYWPSTGQPQIRDLGFIIGFDDGSWVEVKRARRYVLSTPRPYIPLPQIVYEGPGYRLVLEIVPDPQRDVLLIAWRLEARGRLYALLAPHLGLSGLDNTAWVEGPELLARKGDRNLCLLAEPAFSRGSAGYVGFSDGWQDFARHGRMTWAYARAEQGNVALMGELAGSAGVLALGFADSTEGARLLARSSLCSGFPAAREAFEQSWGIWGRGLELRNSRPDLARMAQLSAMVLKVHEDRTYPGAVVASLSIPWGNTTNDPGGYHLVWTRDAVEAGLGFLAVGHTRDALRMLDYLLATQEPDGHWAQNRFPDGRPYWNGVQLDETGFPILLATKLLEGRLIERTPAIEAMVRGAAAFIARNGPLSPQDRWEESAGISPFTLGIEVAALVAAADFAEADEDAYLLSLADYWNERIEAWTFVEAGGPLGEPGDGGYYVRLAPEARDGALEMPIEVRNRVGLTVKAAAMIGLDFLYLARLGLRRADDPRMRSSLAVAERVLKVTTPCGPAFHRYNLDGYGEHEDGSAFDGTGIGRAWPLLTGERGHFELMAGGDPTPWLEAMACMTGPGGLMPEQVWDAAPIPERFLYPGKPTGSAMPLVWAHAEFLKLLTASERGAPHERLEAVRARYDGRIPSASTWHWRRTAPFTRLPPRRELLIEAPVPFVLHLGFDGWQRIEDRPSTPLPFGLHGIRFGRDELAGHTSLEFTFFDPASGQWSNEDHRLALDA
ncbi:glycoside hydrolase family 15 protein [Benzoatithermus flavus]|uniref:Glycoside hydrolase family 15 protein n=1 Tax=Benzoatithermus flavus TaxID=3108223 RepID=A0ABU8XUI9_9PROT